MVKQNEVKTIKRETEFFEVEFRGWFDQYA